MKEIISVVSEYNDTGVLVHILPYLGAYTRGKSEEDALSKVSAELEIFKRWAKIEPLTGVPELRVSKVRARENLRIDDADSEILLIYDTERLTKNDFEFWTESAIYSSECFMKMFDCASDKDWVQKEKERQTFYGKTPATAREMMLHTDQVHEYYLSRIGLTGDFERGEMIKNRVAAINILREGYKNSEFRIFSADGEEWTETKVLRRFIWHDRIHAKALYRHLLKAENRETINPFFF